MIDDGKFYGAASVRAVDGGDKVNKLHAAAAAATKKIFGSIRYTPRERENVIRSSNDRQVLEKNHNLTVNPLSNFRKPF